MPHACHVPCVLYPPRLARALLLHQVGFRSPPIGEAFQLIVRVQKRLGQGDIRKREGKLADKILFLDINWRGTTEDFCSSVDDHKINKERNKLSVVSVEGNSVLLEVK